jgi:hypothetical protein
MDHELRPPAVDLDAWRTALDAALAFRDLAPWDWMHDTAISVFVDEKNAPWFACVLGGGGEVFGLVLYRGEEGFRGMHLLHQVETEADMEEARFAQSAIDVTWGSKKQLDRFDLERLQALGYVPARGARRAWPSFRSHRPGTVPWHLDAAEVRVLTAALPQVCRFAASLRSFPNVYLDREAYEFPMLSPTVENPTEMEWRHWLPPQPPPPVAVRLPEEAAARFRALPKAGKVAMELDLSHSPAPVQDEGRPFFPQQAMVVDAASGFVHAVQLIAPDQIGPVELGNALLKAIGDTGVRPRELRFLRPALAESLRPLAEQLGITRVNVVDHLPMIAEARASLAAFLGR